MTWASQKEMLKLLPGFSDVSVLRFGTIHRNIFLHIPTLCRPYLADRTREGHYYAGQICGVEGYVESIASAIVVALSITAQSRGRPMPELPSQTMLGALMGYVHSPNDNFQPMNANFGILPAPNVRSKRERHAAMGETAIAAMKDFRNRNDWLFA
jgi:methylenetetrahydrofolate--tRNA-(uracil-5-)-methyltransferase